ncbi:DNA repair protein RAD5-like [Trifolium pratense]|uniref:DNA repair protein RAD5-like n=1 Tax=Trifolium pratense TaxID=57577 RepID=UPI001E694A1F|nr:DNA repair protein RAD5-like [Trifolium pratense]
MDHQSLIRFHVSPSREPILQQQLQQDIDMPSLFFIDFEFINTILPWDSFRNNNEYDETGNVTLTIPTEMLCNCTDNDHKSVMYDIFSFVSTNILDTILPELEECAKQMVEENHEEREFLEMDLMIHISTIDMAGEENQNDNGQAQQIVDLLEKYSIDYLSSDSTTKQCSICLEEFDTSSEPVSTKCSHVFHKECMVPWIQRCIDRSSFYSCPLCRGQII